MSDSSLINKLSKSYNTASKRLILLDYDGTLVPFSSHPAYPEADKHAIEQLTKLSSDTKNEVYIISGRERHSLTERFSHLNITIIAEHGYLIKKPKTDWVKTFPELSNGNWKPIFIPIIEAYSKKCPGSFLEEKESALVWHYRKADNDLADRCLVEMNLEISLLLQQHTDLLWLNGNKVIEIKLANCHKGMYVEKLLQANRYDFILAMGDDRTDEDMFKAVPSDGYSIKIGEGETNACLRFKQQIEVTHLLDEFVKGYQIESLP